VSRKPWLLGGGAVLAVAAASLGTAFVAALPPSNSAEAKPKPADTAQVKRQNLVVSDSESGTLGYAGVYQVSVGGPGVLTGLPSAGQIVTLGRTVYQVDGRPVPLWHGETPFWRPLKSGMSKGVDVQELEQNLKDLGYFHGTVDQTFTDATATAIKSWQQALGLDRTGEVDPGAVVVLPTDIRVTAVDGVAGSPAQGKVLDASGTGRVVTVKMPVTKQTEAVDGSDVDITLPDGSHTAGTITSVGTVASKPDPNGGSPAAGNSPTVDVQVTPKDPNAVGKLDGAPVTVSFTSQHKDNVLAVPVGALLAQPEGGYAVETADGHLVAVQLGLFANGQVEVTGAGLREGMTIKVAGE
jgi:hypothetical protein